MAAKHSRPKHAAMATAAGGADVQIAQREVVRSRLLPLTIAELDALLDVPVLRFPQNTKKLASRLRRQDRDVDVAAYRNSRLQPVTVAENSQRDGSGGFYQAEVRRIPPMDREEEFRMARRYEFLRTRLALELQRAGLPAEDASSWAGKSRSEVERLLQRWLARRKQPRDQGYLVRCLEQLAELRNLYVEGSLYIVLAAVHRYRGLGVDVADLIQDGNASLFQAIEGFDWRRDVRFRTYAQYWVQQAILKLLYNSSRTVRIPIWVQKLLGKIRRAQDELRRQGREATPEEIGERLGISAERVAWVLATKRYSVSIDAELSSDSEGSLAQTLTDTEAVPVPETVREGDLGTSLAEAMRDLPERERMILRRRYGLGGREPETLGAIAADLGITAERVRQLQNAAMTRMQRPGRRNQLQAFVDQP